MTGADIRPVAGDPLEHAISQTRRWSSVVSAVGAGNAGSSAQLAGPYSAERTTRRLHWPMLPGCQPFAPVVTSTETQTGGSSALDWARKVASLASRPANRHDQPEAPGNSLASFARVARKASNSGPDAFSAPVGASSPDAGNVRPPQVRPASALPEVASGSGSGDTGHVATGVAASARESWLSALRARALR